MSIKQNQSNHSLECSPDNSTQRNTKKRVLFNLQAQLTSLKGDLIIHNNTSRSQQQNKKNALANLADIVRKSLYVPKKRIETKVSKAVKETRLRTKKSRSFVKKMRSKKIESE